MIFVKAAKGLKVPKETNPHAYIEQVITKVPADSAYYARRISDLDLIEVSEEEFTAQQAEIAAAEEQAAKDAEKASKKTNKAT